MGKTKAPACACIPLWDSRDRLMREASSAWCPTRPTSLLSPVLLLLIVFYLHLHQSGSVQTFPVLSSVHVNKCTNPQYTIGAVLCKRDSSPLCGTLLMGTSPQLRLMRMTLTSQHSLSTNANYNSHPVLTGGNVAHSIAGQPPTSHPLFWVLSSHAALALSPCFSQLTPRGRLWDAVTFV